MEQLSAQKLLPENTPTEYKICPSCKGEWTRLEPIGVCYDCALSKKAEVDAAEKLKGETLAFIGIKGYEQYALDKFKPLAGTEEALEACKTFNPDTDNLYIHGPCGTGKSHLAVSVWRKFFEGKKSGAVYRQPDIMRLFRGREADEEFALLKLFDGYRCLVIDDLGVGRSTEFSNQIIYEIIERRANAMRNGLIITSNLSLDEFAQKSGDDRLPSRIMGLCRRIKITSEKDMRGEK